MPLISPRTDAILALRAQRMSIREIAAAVPCGARTVWASLKRHGVSGRITAPGQAASSSAEPAVAHAGSLPGVHAPYEIVSAVRPPPLPPWTDEIVELHREGLSQREIARRIGRDPGTVSEAVTRYRARWRHDPKRRRESAIFALVGETLRPIAGTGVAIALTAAEIAIHLDALRHVVSRLIVPERDPGIYREAVAALTAPPAIPVEIVLGDFWDVASRTTDPIAFLDYDGMGTLPEDLAGRLSGLANRLTDPAVVRLTACLSAPGGERQLPLAVEALNTIPGREIVRLTVEVAPWERRPRMLTVVAILRVETHDEHGGGP